MYSNFFIFKLFYPILNFCINFVKGNRFSEKITKAVCLTLVELVFSILSMKASAMLSISILCCSSFISLTWINRILWDGVLIKMKKKKVASLLNPLLTPSLLSLLQLVLFMLVGKIYEKYSSLLNNKMLMWNVFHSVLLVAKTLSLKIHDFDPLCVRCNTHVRPLLKIITSTCFVIAIILLCFGQWFSSFMLINLILIFNFFLL